jgi:hypothetical protein
MKHETYINAFIESIENDVIKFYADGTMHSDFEYRKYISISNVKNIYYKDNILIVHFI